MQVLVTRDSVAAGDDATAPNPREAALPVSPTVADLVGWLDRMGPPASVQGGSTWALRLGDAVVAVLSAIDGQRQRLEAVGDQTAPVHPTDRVHLEYLLAGDVDLIAALAREDERRTDLRALARRNPAT